MELNAQQAADFLKAVAAQSYGSGLLEKTSGGAGSIGMIGGKPVKFNTHWKERGGKVSPEMLKSSNELREALGNAARTVGIKGAQLIGIYKLLGLGGDGKIGGTNKDLLSRKTVAKALAEIDRQRNVSSFDGVQARGSKGVRTTFSARYLAVASEKLGVELNAEQVKQMERCISGGKTVFLAKDHTTQCMFLLRHLSGERLGADASDAKESAAFLERLPVSKRLNGLLMVLAAGPGNVCAGLASEAVLDEVMERSNGGYPDVKALKSWSDAQFNKFKTRYPKSPQLDFEATVKDTEGLWRLGTAASFRALMAIDDANLADVLNQPKDSDYRIDLDSWRAAGNGESSLMPLIEKLRSNTEFIGFTNLTITCGADIKDLVTDYRGEQGGIGLSLSSLPKDAWVVNPRMLDNVNVPGDLERTQINANFEFPGGSSEMVETGLKPKGENAKKKACALENAVRQLLNLSKDEPLTPQAKVTMAFFSAHGMGLTRNLFGEHVARNMTLRREGEDVLVRLQNCEPLEPGQGTFDFTVRIRPDGTNRYEYVDVSQKPLVSGDQREKMAHSTVMGWRNTDDADARKDIEMRAGTTYQQQLAKAKELLASS